MNTHRASRLLCAMSVAVCWRYIFHTDESNRTIQESLMGSMLIIAAIVATLMAADGANAQESFFNKRYCRSSTGRGGVLDCGFNTWQQCRVSVAGAQYCFENPYWKAQV